jgi:hypothetical protein
MILFFSVSDFSILSQVLHWRKDHMIVPPCPSSAQVRQELQTGGGADVVPIPSGGASCGNDPFSNYNYTAQVDSMAFPKVQANVKILCKSLPCSASFSHWH